MIPADLESALVWGLAAAVAIAVVVPYVVAFRRRRRQDRARLAEARELGIDRPTAQFPFIDPEHCIGCGACVRACPEGDVLGIVGGVAVVINGLRCVGHGRCAVACPVEAIEIGLGDLKGRRDVPLLTPDQETTIPGVFVAGELSGLALIRNAIDQGARVLRTIAARELAAARRERSPGVVDVLVVGAGPAGIAAALAARELGLEARVVDQAPSLGGTLLHFPRRKMVLTQPVPLPGGDALSREEYSKEELLDLLSRRIADRRLDIRFGERLTGLEGAEREFTVLTTAGRHPSRYVILALGRRGTPRKLGVPGEEREKVMYQLREAESYRGRRILVVGGGDSAIEAAVGLSKQPGNEVTVSYRKNAFYRIKQKNQTAVDSAIARGKVRAVFESEVVEIEEDHVKLRTGESIDRLENDHVFVFIGGEAPYRFLESLGVRFGGAERERSPSRAGAGAAMLLAALSWFATPLPAQESPHGDLEVSCDQCHDTASWKVVHKDVQFRHGLTGYPLDGAHARAACIDCHRSRVFTQVPTACQDCHRDAHSGELGRDCASCHDPRRWDVRSDFQAAHMKTLFPLVGGHARADCEACHTGAPPRQYTLVPTDCVACHAADYRAAVTPAHSGPPSDCRRCHTSAETWTRTNFRHPDRFPLSGAHAGLACEDCHRGPATAVSADCYECHRADYEATRDPDHRKAAFPTQCAACHTTTGWNTAVFDHFTTGFVLDGAHRTVACANCHTSGYAGTPRDCASCHLAQYNATSNPNHATAGFPTTCQNCHSTAAWAGAAFDHSRTRFPLTGAHRSLDCAACHSRGYAGTPSDCASCHLADYNATRDPNHASAGFPTTCENCHSTSSWQGASFDHDASYFPIYSGKHRGTWSSCSTCHVVAGNFQVFECTVCHEHRQSEMDDKHKDVSGYSYSSSACYRCHPDGQGDS